VLSDDDIPWLESGELEDEDEGASAIVSTEAPDSLRPTEMERTAPMRAGARARLIGAVAVVALGLLGWTSTQLLGRVSTTVSAPTSTETKTSAGVSAVALPVPHVEEQAVPSQELGLPAELVAVKELAASSKNSTTSRALLREAYASLNRGDARAALARAKAAVATSPKLAEGWLVLGSAHAALHDGPSAEAAFARCAQLGTSAIANTCKRLAHK
jgi:cytochrome c-type biogenesis protein CcmH/NrfG